MTAAEMLTLLGLRMEDTGHVNFPSATKYSALNVGQRTVVNLINEAYLTELEVQQSKTPSSSEITAGYIAFDSNLAPIRNRFIAVQVKYAGDFKFATMMPFEDVKDIENQYLTPSEDSPVAWIFQNRLHIRPNVGMTELQLYYLGSPAAIASGANSPLNVGLHDIIVDLAEAEMWKMDNKSSRAQLAQANAMAQIKILNERYQAEAPTGVQ